MKNKLFIIVLFFVLFFNVETARAYTCKYEVSQNSVTLANAGILTCEMGHENDKTKYECTWEINNVKYEVEEMSSTYFDLGLHIREKGTCPVYVAMETTTKNGPVEKMQAYFSNDYNDIKEWLKPYSYYSVGAENSYAKFETEKCLEKNQDYYNKLIQKYEKKVTEFKNNKCHEFKLTEKEINGGQSTASYTKYYQCKNMLYYNDSDFNKEIQELKENKCFTDIVYKDILLSLEKIKNEYSDLKLRLEKEWNRKPISSENDNNDTNDKNNFPDNDEYETDYDIEETNIKEICSKPEYRKPMRFIGQIVQFLKIIVPILIIGFGAIDLFKAITASKDDAIKKAIKSIAFRAVAGIVIFLIPGLVQFVMNMVNEWSDYKNSWCCCTECLLNSDCDINSCSSNSCRIEGMNE